ncbi:dienelactone hydrolase family protein [Actinoallomurus sp. CA-150999]|uniref:dienelactone hydrolase family protein n=1 Tax=Actinoallomurus sp. CA-150999 TaxID=3239887 RepID=UPI003D8AD029
MKIPAAGVSLEADLTDGERGLVVFAHGSGSSRRSPRNRQVATTLNTAGFGTLLFDLLTPDEELEDTRTARLRFDIPLLARRLSAVVGWAATRPMGLFGASTGAAAALVTAAERPDDVAAVVSRGGRPDLAGEALAVVRAPTLLIVGGRDLEVLSLNERAASRMPAEKAIVVVPGAGHLFAEPGALEEVARLAENWFARHMRG